jgi:hypothetical protein
MNQKDVAFEDAAFPSRREALRRALGAGVGIAFVLVPGSARSQAAKLSKAAVKYTDAGNVPGKDCDDCSQYVPGRSPRDAPTCKIVEGPISPHGHCIAFSPKGK